MKYSKDHTIYYNSNGDEIPSATTILKILNKPSLSKWANYLGFMRLRVDTVLDDYSRFGTLVHEMISCFLQNHMYIFINEGKVNLSELYGALKTFKDWYNDNSVEVIFSEKQFSSDKYGGTVDFYGKVNGKYTIIDFKTSKKIRISMFIQLALYTMLLEEKGYKVEQVGIVLCNAQHKDTKYITRDELNKYINFAKSLVDLFHTYYNLNESDNWGESII